MEYNSNGYLEATINNEKVYFHYESVDVISLSKVIWKDSLSQELFKCLVEKAKENNGGNRLYTGHSDIKNNYYYFVKAAKLESVLVEIVSKSELNEKLVGFLYTQLYKVVNYSKMSNVFFEINSLYKKNNGST